MSLRIKILIAILLVFGAKTSLNAQRIALTTNVLEDVVLTPNIGVDIVVADKQTLSLDTSFAPDKLTQSLYYKCMIVRAGYKYWLDQAFYAHYVGVDVIASSYDIKLRNFNEKNEYVGLGVGYGYSFLLGKRLNFVPCVGLGLAYGTMYDGHDHMVRPGVGVEATATRTIRPVITRLGITIQYVLN